MTRAAKPPSDAILITGFPSQEARAVLDQALRDDDAARVFALVPRGRAEGTNAMMESLDRAQAARVEVIEGDSRSIDLGLSGQRWRALAAETSRIHLCHALASSNAGRKLAVEEVLRATDEVLELARATAKRSRVIAHSTALVYGDRDGRFFEDDLDVGQHLRDGLVEANARAEKMLRAQMGSLPITVVRPSIVVGDSVTGEIDRRLGSFGLFLLFVTAPPELRLPSFGRSDARLNLVPIDFVAQVAYAAGKHTGSISKTLHIVDRDPLPSRAVFELIAQAAGRRVNQGTLASHLATALVRAPGFERLGGSPRSLLDALVGDAVFDDQNARVCAPHLSCPPLASYVGKIVEYVRASLGAAGPSAGPTNASRTDARTDARTDTRTDAHTDARTDADPARRTESSGV